MRGPRFSFPCSCLFYTWLILGSISMYAGAEALVLSECAQINTTLPSGNFTVNASCTDIAFINVTAPSGSEVNISIASMLIANPTVIMISVTISNCELGPGSTLLVDSSSAYELGSATAVSVMIQNLRGNNGALAFIGPFPSGTTILVSGLNMTVDDMSSAPRLALLDPVSRLWAKIFMLVNITLAGNASMLIVNTSLVVNGYVDCCPLYTIGDMTIANMSTVVFQACRISGSAGNSVIVYSTVNLTGNSSMLFTSCNMSSASATAFGVNSTVTLVGGSSLSFTTCSMQAFGPYTLYLYSVALTNQSSMSFDSCSMSSASATAFGVASTVTLTGNSSLSFASCIMSSANASAFRISSAVTLAGGSSLSFASCSMSSASVSAFGVASTVTLTGGSSLSFTVCRMSAFGPNTTFYLYSVALTNQSSMSFIACNMSSASRSAFGVASTVTLTANSSMPFTACNMSSGSESAFVLASMVTLTGGSSLSFTACSMSAFKIYTTFSLYSVALSNQSSMLFTACNMSSATGSAFRVVYAMTLSDCSSISITTCFLTASGPYDTLILNAPTLSSNSSIIVHACTVTATMRQTAHVGLGDGVNAMGVYSGLNLSGSSYVAVESSIFISAGGNALFVDFMLLDGGGSYWFVTGSTFSTTIPYYPPVEFGTGGLAVGNASWFTWSSNSLSSFGNSTCVQAAVAVNITGRVSVLENTCTAGDAMWAGAASGDGLLYQRCNKLNETVLLVGTGFPSPFVSAGTCGPCSSTSDCYVPLGAGSSSSQACSINASNRQAICQCFPSGLADLCLVSTPSPPPSAVPPTADSSAAPPTTVVSTQPAIPTTAATSSTAEPSTVLPSTVDPSTALPSTADPSTALPPTADPSTVLPPTADPSTALPSTADPSTVAPWTTPVPTAAAKSMTESLTQVTRSLLSYSRLVHASDTLSCELPNLVGRASIELIRSSTMQQDHFPSNAPVPVVVLASSDKLVVSIVPAVDGVAMTSAGNATGTIGSGWAAQLESKTTTTPTVAVYGEMSRKLAQRLSLIAESLMIVAVDVAATGSCIPAGYRERLVFTWVVTPAPPPPPLHVATVATFRASSIVSGILGNPMSSMTATSMISMQSLEACLFSDVDPLDSSVSPTGTALGDILGQYYRGGAGVALLLYGGTISVACASAHALSYFRGTSLTSAYATLRFPSAGIVVVGLFGQGLASCGMSLIRLSNSSPDVLLGIMSLIVCATVVMCAFIITRRAQLVECRLGMANEQDRPAIEAPLLVRGFIRVATWKMEWEDRPGGQERHFARRYSLLIDDLRLPWWTSVELGSSLFQGAVLGFRVNSLAICIVQNWLLVVQTGLMALAAVYLRPCGAPLSNAFLVLSKIGTFGIALLGLVSALTLDDTFSSSADTLTSVTTAIGLCQTLIQVLTTLLLSATTMVEKQRQCNRSKRTHRMKTTM